SDDLFYPGLYELIGRSCWFLPQLVYYIKFQQEFQCAEIDLLHLYYIGFMCLIMCIIIVQLVIVVISSLGTITNTEPRARIKKYLYMRIALMCAEMVWSFIGIVWLAKINWSACSKLINFGVFANIIFCWIAFGFIVAILVVLFDPISHLPEHDVTTKRHVLYTRLKSLFCFCCCVNSGNSRNQHYENSYRQISAILEMMFRGGNLTPSDVLAGIVLLSNKEKDQFRRETKIQRQYQLNRLSRPDEHHLAQWMSINTAAYFIKYAVATYSWPYYIYMNNLRGFRELCCFECCLGDSSVHALDTDEFAGGFIRGDTKSQRNWRAFKFLSKVKDCDLVYANFTNDLFFVPFCVLVDHVKKTVVITIRGTLSLRDVITDITAECEYFDIDDLRNQPCHVGIHNTAVNILNELKSLALLEKAFEKNPDYDLLVTGHSLGAGTAVILALKLKAQYENIKCIAYSPPGGLISTALADYTKSFVMSVVLGDDIVPRLSLRSVHNLKADILKVLHACNLPKYKIAWKYSVGFIWNCDEDQSEMDDDLVSDDGNESDCDPLVNSISSGDSSKMLLENAKPQSKLVEVAIEAASTAKQLISDLDRQEKKKVTLEVKQMMNTVYETYPELQLPGNILYIYRVGARSRKRSQVGYMCSKVVCCLCNLGSMNQINDSHFDSRWASRDEFRKILITKRILIDHFPNALEHSLKYFYSNQTFLA
ncbi:sn1-specific diacylglycerol lipase beta, partial [Brachionus plicatilis]